ncbi:MAG: hypothetical protein JW847_09930 [Candidatus Omnitrophica bacterium]|nr:hypothetical protein [Candidatus Omnitrophota bacterium]
MKKEKLRFGIMCDSDAIADWQAQCIDQLLASGIAELKLVMIPDKERIRKKNPWRKLLRKVSNKMLYRLWQRFVVRIKSDRRVLLGQRMASVSVLKCQWKNDAGSKGIFSDGNIREIRKYGLDFILRFGFGIIRGEILNVPRYGIWSFHHGDGEKYCGQPGVFWEMYDDGYSIGGILQRITENIDRGIVLKRWWMENNKISWSKNLDELRYAGVGLPRQVCIDIVNNEADYFNVKENNETARLNKTPGNLKMCVFFFKVIRNRVVWLFLKLFQREKWNIGIIEQSIIDVWQKGRLENVKWFPEYPPGGFVSDPFGLFDDNHWHIFFEELKDAGSKGEISEWIVDKTLRVLDKREAFSSQEHVSYPYLIEHEGEFYSIPETSREGKVTLFRVDLKTGKFREAAILLEGVKLSDPTVFRYHHRWWLFGVSDGPVLCGWHAPDLFGPWTPHANNPLKIDICTARPAGTPFEHEGVLYRPAQDCSRTYGGRVIINRIKTLTPTKFDEEVDRIIEPEKNGKYPEGFHTLSSAGRICFCDGKKWEYAPKVFLRKFEGSFLNKGSDKARVADW